MNVHPTWPRRVRLQPAPPLDPEVPVMTTAALVAFLTLLTAALAALTRAIVRRPPGQPGALPRLQRPPPDLGWACAAAIIGTSATAVGAVIVIWL